MSGSKAQANSYKHKPFCDRKSIRLLSLQPGRSNEIRITLQEVPLRDLPRYEALSYAWEGQAPSYPVSCHGAQLLVTKNCQAALRSLRLKRHERLLWIDSICIDQTSAKERENQVQLMEDVYSKAANVIIWLGDETELSRFAMSYMNDCHKLKESKWREPARNYFLKRKQTAMIEKEKQLVQDGRSWFELMGSVYSRSWFTRVWTVQEYVLSKNAIFLCGTKEVHSSVLFSELDEWRANLWKRLDPSYQVQSVRQMKVSWAPAFFSYLDHFNALRTNLNSKDVAKEKVSVTDLLSYGRLQSATEAKDVVFGMYGILRRLDVAIPKPCYDDHIEEIYAEATRAAIDHDRKLDILLETGHSKSYPNLASWVPDWNTSPTHGLCRIWSRKLLDSFHASKNQKPSYSFSHDGKELHVLGKIIDTIASRSPMEFPARSDSSDPRKLQLAVRKALRDWIVYASEGPLYDYRTKEPLKDVLRMTLATGMDWVTFQESAGQVLKNGDNATGFDYWVEERPFDNWVESQLSEFWGLNNGTEKRIRQMMRPDDGRQDIYNFLESMAARKSKSGLLELGDHLVSKAKGERAGTTLYDDMIFRYSSELRLFKTHNGYMGKGLSSLQEDDNVILIAGVSVPMIARKTGNAYQLIGPSYIHGIMYGQEWPENERDLVDIPLS